MDNSIQGELDTASLRSHSVLGDKDGKFSREAAASRLSGKNASNVIAALAHDAGALGDRAGVRKGDVDNAAIHPGLTLHSIDLLEVLLAVHCGGVGLILVRGGGDTWGLDGIPVHAGLVDILCGCQYPLGRSLIRAGVDGEIGYIPVVQQVAPQGHFGGVVALIYTGEAQILQGLMRIAGGHDAEHLGIVGCT